MAALVSKLHVSMPTLQIGTKERKKIYQIMIIDYCCPIATRQLLFYYGT
jgi:hypothetical protein